MTFAKDFGLAEKCTARVIINGEVRLSADLITSPQYYPKLLKRHKIIELLATRLPPQDGVKKVYFTNPRARSGRISLIREIRALGLDPVKLRGKKFRAKLKGPNIQIFFKQRRSNQTKEK